MRGAQRRAKEDGARAPELPRLSIPTQLEPAADYKERLGALLRAEGTHVYIDTSFLMWSTKIGPAARAQLLDWLRGDLGERAHVPTWCAHEYLRHHVAGTIVDELTKRSTEVAQLAGSTFGYFRPFLDDPALPAAEGWDGLRASTRTAVNSLARLAAAAREWKKTYPSHAEQIIEYINERVLPVDALFDDLQSIAEQGAARYEGRIPPGYQDRNKKGDAEDDPDEARTAGANRYGDLIFWKEALADAATRRASAVVILTNDRKNDWRMGGETGSTLDEDMLSLKKSWRPVPRIHPMLALEAKLAGVGDVALVDSQYLAALLTGVDRDRVNAFADVAIVPDLAPEPTEDERRTGAVGRGLAEDAATSAEAAASAAERAAEDGLRFADDPAVKATLVAMKKALLESRAGPDARGEEIIGRVRADVGGNESFDALATAETFAGMDHVALAAMTRGLHDRAVGGEAGLTDPMVDLVGLLDELPPATAGALYLGLLASMYLLPSTGNSRIPPESPAAEQILARLDRPSADVAVKVIAQRLAGNVRQPLHSPGTGELECRFETEVETMEADEVRSLKIGGVEVLTAAQDDPGLRLRDLVGGGTATGGDILDRAAALFVIPRDLLTAGGDEATEYSLTETIGFRPPAHVFHNKEAL
jgi:PIN like domain